MKTACYINHSVMKSRCKQQPLPHRGTLEGEAMDEITMTIQDRNTMINKMAEVVKQKNIKIEEMQSALRACLGILYDIDYPNEELRKAVIDQVHQVL